MVGHTAMISAGEFVQLSGAWVNDRTHGPAVPCGRRQGQPADNAAGHRERYLGIGPVYARRLDRGGAAVFNLIEQEPERSAGGERYRRQAQRSTRFELHWWGQGWAEAGRDHPQQPLFRYSSRGLPGTG